MTDELTPKQMHAQNSGRLDAIEARLEELPAIKDQLAEILETFNQMQGGWKLLYRLGGLVVGIAIIWGATWATIHKS